MSAEYRLIAGLVLAMILAVASAVLIIVYRDGE